MLNRERLQNRLRCVGTLVLRSIAKIEGRDGNQGSLFLFRAKLPARGAAVSAGRRARSQGRDRVLPRLRRGERGNAARTLDAAGKARVHSADLRLPRVWRERRSARTPRAC